MSELKVDTILQNIKDKAIWLQSYIDDNDLAKSEIGYIGDDVNDLSSMRLCGFVGCPADACKDVKSIADYISPLNGGHGAVRDCIEYLLNSSGEWTKYVEQMYGCSGIGE
jgi:3-deoxy-D-manno-octulosonate 8-phosphate phosphatase (KDO 8-P phosphatase)